MPAMTHSQMPVGRQWFKRCPIGNSMWLVFNGWVTCKYHIAAPRQILSILFFCLLLAQFYNTSLLPWHQVPSSSFFTQSTNPVTTDFASADPMHGQGGSRSRLRFQHRERSWWPSAGPGHPSCLCEGSVMFAHHRFHSRPYHWKRCECSEFRQLRIRNVRGRAHPGASLWLLLPAAAWWSQLHAVPSPPSEAVLLQPFWMLHHDDYHVLAGVHGAAFFADGRVVYFSNYDQSLLVYAQPPRWSHIVKAPGPWLAPHGLCLLLEF